MKDTPQKWHEDFDREASNPEAYEGLLQRAAALLCPQGLVPFKDWLEQVKEGESIAVKIPFAVFEDGVVYVPETECVLAKSMEGLPLPGWFSSETVAVAQLGWITANVPRPKSIVVKGEVES